MHTENYYNKHNDNTIKIINEPTSTFSEIISNINKYTNFNDFLIFNKRITNENKNNSTEQIKDLVIENKFIKDESVINIKNNEKNKNKEECKNKKINIVMFKPNKVNNNKEEKEKEKEENEKKENDDKEYNNDKTDFKSLLKKILIKKKMNHELFFLIIEEIEKRKDKYNFIYCNEYKLFLMMQLEDNVNKWSSLEDLSFYSPKNKKSKHFENIRAQYERWCKNDIFKKAYNNIKPYNYSTEETIFEYEDEIYMIDVNKDFYIDSTNIFNQRGSENIIINPELKKKKITKITEICDVDGFVVSISFNKPLEKVINYNHEKKKIKTAKNDSKCIKETIDNINKNIELKNVILIGDKGYKINNNDNNNNNNDLKIITPNKKNQKKKLINRHDNNKLKYRHIVENSINGWKHKGRINLRKDKKISTFSGWVYLSVLNHNLRINEIKKYLNNADKVIN